jgi:hypothetical protein
MNSIKVTQDEANQKDLNDWLDLALQQWPDCTITDLTEIIQSPRQAGFLVRADNKQAFSSAVPCGVLGSFEHSPRLSTLRECPLFRGKVTIKG